MVQNLWIPLANNAAMLLALFVAYEASNIISKQKKILGLVVNGILSAAICIAIMSMPYELYPGVFFDTRTILISVVAIIFGGIPVSITVIAAVLFRIISGGDGTAAGIATILTSAVIGLIWRKYIFQKQKKWRWASLYAMSIVVHATMLLCMLLLPYPQNLNIIGQIALPVMLIYPIASVMLCVLLLHQQERIEYQEKLKTSEEKYRTITENISDVVWMADLKLKTIFVSSSVKKLLGEDPEKHIKKNLEEKFPPDSLVKLLNMFTAEMKIEKDPKVAKDRTRVIELEHYKADGQKIWLSMHISFLRDQKGKAIGILGVSRDITARKNAELALEESERSKTVFISHIPGIAYRCKYDKEWTMEFISEGCFELTGYQSEELIGNKRISYNDLIVGKYREDIWKEWINVVKNRSKFKGEYEIITALNEKKWVLEMGQPIFDKNDTVEALEGIIVDISESKRRYEQIQYMNEHDFLTGLYNRRYFEEKKHQLDKKENLPLALIVADINGVKLINDAFGHLAGDNLIRKTGEIIKLSCPEGAVLSRTGGDEFCILLTKTTQKIVAEIISSIADSCRSNNANIVEKSYIINVALGSAIKDDEAKKIEEIEQEAEENMYRSKLLERESHHNAVISSVMATMYARSQETEEHARRIAELSQMLGKALGLSKKNLNELELLAMLHDIGKIGIDDNILNKPGQLTKEEWSIMKKHPEIGYRIAMSTKDLEPIAPFILFHHEQWDGRGYPQGVAGEEIPLLSRILAIADAYDAMTQDRVYRKALTHQQAINEIIDKSGKQFDPNISVLFVNLLAEGN